MIERSSEAGIVTLRLAHGKVSAFDLELCEAITAELRAASAAEAKAVIITGSGTIFSAGVDLVRLTNEGAPYVARFFPALTTMLVELFDFPKPIIAAVNGHAIAGGCLLAAACDYRLMSGGRIGVPELLVGVPFPAIAIEVLRFAAGAATQSLAYSGHTMTPEEARALRLIDEVVEPEWLVPRAAEMAAHLASIPADSFRITKRLLRREYLERAARSAASDQEALEVWLRPEVHAHIREYMAKVVKK